MLARAAQLVCAHYLPVARATRLMRSMRAHLLRDLRAIHTADPDTQLWTAAMATTLTDANTAAAAARAAGQTTLDPDTLATIRNHYRGATALSIHINSTRAGPLDLHPPHRLDSAVEIGPAQAVA